MNEFARSRSKAERYKLMYPAGTRLELIEMGDDPDPVPPGTRGTVTYIDADGNIGVDWNNGRTLSLVLGIDKFRKLSPKEIASEKNAASFETVGPTIT